MAVTTHYETVKARALSDARLRNASWASTSQMATFKLRLDVPGASSAWRRRALRARGGIIAGRARSCGAEQGVRRAVKRLESQSQSDQQRAELAEQLVRANLLRAELEEERARQRAREKKALGDEAQRLMSELREARGDLDRAKKLLRKQRLEQDDVKSAQQRIEEAAAREALAKAAALAQRAEADDARRDVAIEAAAHAAVPVSVVEFPSKASLGRCFSKDEVSVVVVTDRALADSISQVATRIAALSEGE